MITCRLIAYLKDISSSGKALLVAAFCSLTLCCCVGEEQFDNTKHDNFEALWKIMDEHYCFFDYKDIDWNAIHDKYEKVISEDMSNSNLFEVMGNMLAELKDGHVNLYATHNSARYWNWYLDYPRNYSEKIVEKYLGDDYRIGGGLNYTILDDNIGYVSYTSFSNGIGNGNINEMLRFLDVCNGIIIDVRNNGGGEKTNATRLASHFTNEKTLVGYISHKTGKGHSDFSKPEEVYIEPSKGVRWQKKVVILMNRHSFSATNDFISYMSNFPNVTLMGDKSGGGSGMPFSSELPNGWGVRFSACPTYSSTMEQIEFGIEPEITTAMSKEDEDREKDTMIEDARNYLNGKR